MSTYHQFVHSHIRQNKSVCPKSNGLSQTDSTFLASGQLIMNI
jgi:hypothetical protein